METDLQSQLIEDDLSSMIPAFHYGTQIIGEDLQRLNGESIELLNRVQSLPDRLSTIAIAVEEESASSEATRYSTMMLEQEIKSMNETVQDLQHVSYDGTLIWRITGVKEKMSMCLTWYFFERLDVHALMDHLGDAESERQTSVYSPPFFSSPSGYKMRARLYFHGDGNARRTHMSVFFVLMRSPNDAILKFPFNYKVTFCLYDQTPQQRHIIDSFRPDIRSNSFQRPRSEMNIASGIPKFFPLAMIQQEENPYVRDDTMFIKIMVDFGDLPKSILPYVINLNPGMPMNAQQRFIQEKIGKRVEEWDCCHVFVVKMANSNRLHIMIDIIRHIGMFSFFKSVS